MAISEFFSVLTAAARRAVLRSRFRYPSGVGFRRVGRQKGQINTVFFIGEPSRYYLGMMHTQIIDYQIDFLERILNQGREKRDEIILRIHAMMNHRIQEVNPMRNMLFLCSLSIMLAATNAVAAGQDFCNRAFPGAIKVCHPLGTAPAGVVNLGGGWQLAVLDPTSGWRNVNAGTSPALATFHHGKLVSLDRHIPYFENVQSVVVQPSPNGGHVVTIHAYKGGNAPDRYFTMTIHVLPNGQITVS